MSKCNTLVYVLIAALSLVVAIWQPRDTVAEAAGDAIARALQG